MESNYLNISKLERNKRRKAGKGNYLYTRYADDFVILCNGTKAEARQMKEEIGGLLRNMRLTLSEEKTQITHITEGFTFLGYEIIKRTGIHGKMVPKVFVPKKAIKKFQDKLKAILAPGTMQESLCQAQDNATSFKVRAPYAASLRACWLHCAANACGGSPSRAPCGRS